MCVEFLTSILNEVFLRMPRKFLLPILLVLTGCKMPWKSTAPAGDLLRISLGSDPIVIDPQLAESGVAVFVARQLTSTLFEVSEELKVLPKDAQSYEWKNEGHTLVVLLKGDLFWSDNQALTACHYRDGILRALSPGLLSPYADLFFSIQGAESFKNGQSSQSSVSLTCDNQKRELKLELLQAYSPKILFALSFVNSAPARLDVMPKPDSSWLLPKKNTSGISNGPYVLKEWQRDQRVILQKRSNAPSYDQAKISTIEMPIIRDANTAFTLYESGQLDVLDEIGPAQLFDIKKRSDHHSSPWLTTYMVGFSFKSNPALKNLNLRKALAAVAHQEEIPLLLPSGEQAAFAWVPPSLIPDEFQAKQSLFNPSEARKFFAESAKPLAKKPLRIYFNSGERHKLIMERLAHNFKEHLALKTELYPIEWKVLLSTLKFKAPDMYRYAWTAVYPDAVFFLELFHSKNINNFGGWKNQEYDLIVEGLMQVPLDKRDAEFWKKVQRAQQILVRDDPAIIPIYHYVKNTLIKDFVKGLRVSPLGLSALKNAQF